MIPKYPDFDENLSNEQIKSITDAVFVTRPPSRPCDVLFVFGGTHPGLWETAALLYHRGMGNHIICTGGLKPNRDAHPTWKEGDASEAHVIGRELMNRKIPSDRIVIEDQSESSLANVLNSMPIIKGVGAQSVIIICKSYAAGRQYRTFAKYAPDLTVYIESFDTTVDENGPISSESWYKKDRWRSLILGEYLRIVKYGQKGDIINDLNPVKGLEKLYERYDVTFN